ncbi:MAG: DNA primase [Epulopiscium sp. Nele67-Bin004]|nr:MAG: DNA primase [Epulopiscium sp. Nele67-Bin004]
MYFSDTFIEKIRAQSDIVSVISEHTKLTKKGHSHVGLCPFHSEKTPSFSVSDDKQMYYCFGCGAGGNIITFVMEKENLAFVDAIEELANRANIPLEFSENSENQHEKVVKQTAIMELHVKSARFYYFNLQQTSNPEIKDYLAFRQLDEKTIKKFGLGYAPSDYTILYNHLKMQGYNDNILLDSGLFSKSQHTGKLYDKFSNRLMFPIFNVNKKVIAFGGRVFGDAMPKYLNSPETIIFDKSQTLYGLNLAKMHKHDYYILVEGYMDVIAMHKAGFTQTVASLGTAFTTPQARLLKRYTSEVVIMYDSDQAGKKATFRAMAILREVNINARVVELLDTKDPDDFLVKYGAEKLQKCIDTSKTDVWFQIMDLQLQYDIKVPEQKIKFLQNISEIIAKLASSIEQSVYVDEVSKKYDIDKVALEAEIKRVYVGTPKPIETTSQIGRLPREFTSNISIDLLSVLYHYKQIFPKVENYIGEWLFDEGVLQDLYKCIVNAIKFDQEIDLGYLNSKYVSKEEQQIISNVILGEDTRYQTSTLLNKMLNDTIKKLNDQHFDRQIKELSAQPQKALELQNLLSARQDFKKLNIAVING